MNKELLLKRIDFINNEINQTKSNYAKLEGHLFEANHWLSEISKADNELENKVELSEEGREL